MQSSTSKCTIKSAIQCQSYKYPEGENVLIIRFIKNSFGNIDVIETKQELPKGVNNEVK